MNIVLIHLDLLNIQVYNKDNLFNNQDFFNPVKSL